MPGVGFGPPRHPGCSTTGEGVAGPSASAICEPQRDPVQIGIGVSAERTRYGANTLAPISTAANTEISTPAAATSFAALISERCVRVMALQACSTPVLSASA